MNKKIHLDQFEQDIEDNYAILEPITDMGSEIDAIKKAALLHSKRKKSITIRIPEMDLEIIKINASKLGIPYQTYINMLIHQDVTRLHK